MKELCRRYIDENFSELYHMATRVCVWAEEPDADNCAEFEHALRALASEGNPKAAALYFLIYAYDDHKDTFSEAVALKQLLETNAVKEYHKMLEEEFEDVLDEKHYDYLYMRPMILSAKYLFDENTPQETEQST